MQKIMEIHIQPHTFIPTLDCRGEKEGKSNEGFAAASLLKPSREDRRESALEVRVRRGEEGKK